MAEFKKKIHRILEYIFYRTYGYYYEKEEDPSGVLVFALPFLFLFLSVSFLFASFCFHIEPSRDFALIIAFLAIFLIIFWSKKYDAEAKYLSLKKKYKFKEEPHRKLKGWLVLLYYICGFLIYMISILVSLKHLK